MLEIVNSFLAYSAVLLQALSVLILLLLVFGFKNQLLEFVKKNFILLGFLVSLLSALFSLFYSQIIGFLPCFLCWWQRIFMFPLVFLFGVGLWKKFTNTKYFTFPFVIIGGLFALYHTITYYLPGDTGSCDASGVPCDQILVSELGGYISVPTLSLTGFFAILVILLVAFLYNRGIGD